MYTCTYLFSLLCVISMAQNSEPEQKCYSRFDYDEKMLLKQLRFEDKVKKFEDELKIMKEMLELEQAKRAELFDTEINSYKEINAEENIRQHNMTEMLREAVKQSEYILNDTVQNFTVVLRNELKEMTANLDSEKLRFNETFHNVLDELRERSNAQNKSHTLLIKKVNEVVEKAKADLKTALTHFSQETLVKAVIEKVDKAVETYKKYSREDVVFTVTTPDDQSKSSILKFKTAITNEKSGYNSTTGIFTCPVPGLYYFSLHLVKKEGISTNEFGCYIRVNNVNFVRAFFEPYDYSYYDFREVNELGGYGISNSMFVRLEGNDAVSVGGCIDFSSLEQWSSFSGHLITHTLY